jgi:hypothetical protein
VPAYWAMAIYLYFILSFCFNLYLCFCINFNSLACSTSILQLVLVCTFISCIICSNLCEVVTTLILQLLVFSRRSISGTTTTNTIHLLLLLLLILLLLLLFSSTANNANIIFYSDKYASNYTPVHEITSVHAMHAQ